MKKLSIISVVLLSTTLTSYAAQEKAIGQADKLMEQMQERMHNIRMLLATYRPEHADRKAADTAGLADVVEDLRGVLGGLAEVDKIMLGSLTFRFDNLPRLARPGWKFAVRHNPFSTVLPNGMDVRHRDGKVVIHKERGKVSYHACFDRPLRNGNRFVLRFSLPVRGGGGTPVPYFGLRDVNGEEFVFVLFSSYPRPDEIHEIKVTQSGDTYIVIYNGRIQRQLNTRYKLKQLKSPPYLFFHMNDLSEIVIHDVLTDAPPPKPRPPALPPLPPTPQPDYRELVHFVMKNTPEYIHFTPDTDFSWCIFEPLEPDILSQLTEAVLTNLRDKYTVYRSQSEIPHEKKVLQDGKIVAYKDGFNFRIRVELINRQTVKIFYYDWESLGVGSCHHAVYQWTQDTWKVIEKSLLDVR